MKLLRRILIALVTVAALAACAGLGLLWWSGAWGAFFPTRDHDRIAPELPGALARPSVLLFTKTNAFRHTEAIEAGSALFEEIAQRRGWGLFRTENGAVFAPDPLSRFDVVVFHNASGDMLDEAQESAFRAWLEAGGGWVGTHAAGDGSHEEWRWYHETLIGAHYRGHIMGPQFQQARVVVEDRRHPAALGLPAEFQHVEEWYSWETSARDNGFHVIASVDESSYEPFVRMFGQEQDVRMGDHPVVWSRCVGRGRALYSAMGHQAAAYAQPEIRALLEDAVAWAAGEAGDECR